MLLEMLIVQMCADLSGQERDACTKAAEAVSIQYNIKDPVGKAEKVTKDAIQRKVEKVTGKEALAITLFVAKVTRDKEVSTTLVRERGKMPTVYTSVGQKGGRVTFGWSF